jgi:hypothetical protein
MRADADSDIVKPSTNSYTFSLDVDRGRPILSEDHNIYLVEVDFATAPGGKDSSRTRKECVTTNVVD